MTKSEIRGLIKQRCQENKASLVTKSAEICQKLLNAPEYQNADEIFAYMALPDEADLTKLMQEALNAGKKVAVPKILSQQDGIMEFFYLDKNKAFSEQTTDGVYGIAEPDQNNPAKPDSNKKILILVPGRAFTNKGDRLGRGKGYYDRYLEKNRLPNITVAGVCFDFQVLPELPTEPCDIKMDVILRG